MGGLETSGWSRIPKTSLLRRLQVQTLPNTTPPVGKIQQFIKIVVDFEPIMQFDVPSLYNIV